METFTGKDGKAIDRKAEPFHDITSGAFAAIHKVPSGARQADKSPLTGKPSRV
jgi:hypothetical protein